LTAAGCPPSPAVAVGRQRCSASRAAVRAAAVIAAGRPSGARVRGLGCVDAVDAGRPPRQMAAVAVPPITVVCRYSAVPTRHPRAPLPGSPPRGGLLDSTVPTWRRADRSTTSATRDRCAQSRWVWLRQVARSPCRCASRRHWPLKPFGWRPPSRVRKRGGRALLPFSPSAISRASGPWSGLTRPAPRAECPPTSCTATPYRRKTRC